MLALVCAVLVLISSAGAAEGPRHVATCLALGEGPAGRPVSALLQDSRGYLWIGTDQGVARVSAAGVRDAESLGLARVGPVVALAEEPAGTLWLATARGLWRHGPEGLRVLTIGDGMPADGVTALVADPKGGLWVGTTAGPAHLEGETVRPLVRPESPLAGPTSGLAVDERGRLWIATQDGAVGRLDGGAVVDIPVRGSCARSAAVLASLPEQGIWMGCARGLFRATGSELLPVEEPGAPSGPVVHLGSGGEGALLVGTEDQGLLLRGPEGWHAFEEPVGLPGPGSSAALVDREGTVWIGASPSGLCRIPSRFALAPILDGPALGASVTQSLRLGRDSLLVGSSRGLLLLRSGREIVRAWGVDEGLPSSLVLALARQRDAVFVGTSAGLARLPLGRDPCAASAGPCGPRSFGRVEPLTRGSAVRQLVVDASEQLWAATDLGVLRIPPQGEPTRWTRSQGLPADRVAALHPGEPLLAATDRGFAQLVGEQFEPLRVQGGVPLGVRCLHESPDGLLWVGTGHGLWRLERSPGSQRLVRDALSDELPGPDVHHITSDERGTLLVGTTAGLLTRRRDGRISVYTESSGLLAGLVARNGLLVDPQGLWVGTARGLSLLQPAFFDAQPPPPLVHLDEILVGGEPVPSLQEVTVRPEDPVVALGFAADSMIPRSLEIHAAPPGVELRFDASVLREPQRLRYASLLEPHDVRFSVPSSEPSVRYWGLTPGTHYFRLRYTLNGRAFTEVEHQPRIVVQPSLIQSRLFVPLAISVALVVVFVLLVSLRNGFVQRRQNAELKSQLLEHTYTVDEQNRELEEKRRQLEELSLRDTLTGLHNRRYFEETVGQAVQACLREYANHAAGGREDTPHNADLGLIMVDIDHFKRVNDTYGHAAGDEVLENVAMLLRSAVRKSDSVVRWGGEEFLILARRSDHRYLGTLAGRVLDRVREFSFDLSDGRSLRCTCSLGLASFPPARGEGDGGRWERVLELADQALYRAKNGGRDRAVGVLEANGPLPGPTLPDLDDGLAQGGYSLFTTRGGAD